MATDIDVKYVTKLIVELLPVVDPNKAEQLAYLIVNHPGVYPDNSFKFDECAAFVVAKHRFNDMYRNDKEGVS